MGFFEAAFEITEEKDCPMYGRGDRFQVSGLALATSDNKPTCLFLAREVTSYMIKFLGEQRFSPKKEARSSINCGGCTGLVKLGIRKGDQGQYATMHMRMLAASKAQPETKDISSLSSLLNSFTLFQVMDELSLEELIPHLKVKEYAAGDQVIKKGDESSALYMVLTGSVEVNDNGNILAYLGRGEIFGEMSILTGKPVGATVKVVEPTKIIWISNEQFRLMMLKYPSIQLGITKILAQRLTTSNMLNKEASGKSSFTGQLSEIPVAELCQFVNNNSKTGVVTVEFEGGKGVLSFASGELVKAEMEDLHGTEAFYALLKENEGCFNFSPDLADGEKDLPPLGSFMNLLMEGLQKIDEEKELMGA